VERVYGRDRLPRLRQLALQLLARLSYRGVLNGLPKRSNPLVLIDKDKLPPDRGHHVLDGVWVRFAAEDENLVIRLAGHLVLIELVVVYTRREKAVRKKTWLLWPPSQRYRAPRDLRLTPGGIPEITYAIGPARNLPRSLSING
jgi:hypothetical protein